MSYYVVVLRRSNGRFVKEEHKRSRYAAKKLQRIWNDEYDGTYYTSVEQRA